MVRPARYDARFLERVSTNRSGWHALEILHDHREYDVLARVSPLQIFRPANGKSPKRRS
jgi:hypothetical protein